MIWRERPPLKPDHRLTTVAGIRNPDQIENNPELRITFTSEKIPPNARLQLNIRYRKTLAIR